MHFLNDVLFIVKVSVNSCLTSMILENIELCSSVILLIFENLLVNSLMSSIDTTPSLLISNSS